MLQNTNQQPLPQGHHVDTISNCAKRQRDDYGAYTVVLKTSPVQMMNLGTGSGPSHLAEWNEQLSAMLQNLQGKLDTLSPVSTHAPLSPLAHVGPLSPSLLLSPTTDRAFESDNSSDEFISCDSHPPSPTPISHRLGTRTFTARHSNACQSDRKHSLRRVYTSGLMRPRNSSMRVKLREYHIDSSNIIHSQHIAHTINEFVVKAPYVRTFVRHLRGIKGVKVLKFFNPLRPTHAELSLAQRATFPGMYRQRVRMTFSDGVTSGPGFIAYAQDYVREFGL